MHLNLRPLQLTHRIVSSMICHKTLTRVRVLQIVILSKDFSLRLSCAPSEIKWAIIHDKRVFPVFDIIMWPISDCCVRCLSFLTSNFVVLHNLTCQHATLTMWHGRHFCQLLETFVAQITLHLNRFHRVVLMQEVAIKAVLRSSLVARYTRHRVVPRPKVWLASLIV